MNRNFALCGLAAACVTLSACATITRGTSQKYSIETSPTAADIKLSTGQTCISPCKLNLKRKHGFVVTANKPGHEQAVVTVKSKIKGGGAAGVAGNAIFGGVIGAAVDVSNGSMNDLTPNPLKITLKPLSVEAVAATATEVAPATSTDTVPADASATSAPAAEPTAAPTAEAAPAAAPAPGAE